MGATSWWTGLLDVTRRPDPSVADLVGSLVVADTDLPAQTVSRPAFGPPATVVVTGGAGQIAGPAALARRRGVPLGAVRVTLRDLDDLRGNARRVVAAVDAAVADGALTEHALVQVAMPAVEPGPDWQAAVDEVAALELVLALPCAEAAPATVARWIETALDRETGWVTTGGDPVLLLAATRRCLDGATAVEVAATLAADDAEALDVTDDEGLLRARRWLRRGAADPTEVAERLRSLGARP